MSYGALGTLRSWGVDGNGNDFCCELDAGSNCTMITKGTSYGDNLANFTASPSFDLNCNLVTVEGREGPDQIYGSRLTGVLENLLGDEGDDTIHGHGGADYIDGDAGNDTLYGDDGADEIYGSSDDDTIYGGDATDTIDGGDDDDDIYGGDHDDTIHGGAGSDLVCGEFGSDSLYGDDDSDYVYGGAGADAYNRGNGGGGDYCEFDGDNNGCEDTTLTSCTRTP